MALSRWPGQGCIQGWGSWPRLACLPADSSGTVSWLPAKLPPLSAGWHPGPIARGPAGGQQLECRRAVIPARRLKAGPGVGASSRLPPPSPTPHPVAPRSQAQLCWLSAPPPSWHLCRAGESRFPEAAARSTAGQWVHGTVLSLLQLLLPHLENGASYASVACLPGQTFRQRSLSAHVSRAVPGAKDAASS